ncbi:MAG: hypothetical protein ABI776_17870 [Nocardioidaceae bacterium]
MSTITGEREFLPGAFGPSRTRSRGDARWDRARHLLVLGWLLVAVVVPVLGERSTSWSHLKTQVTSGEVASVRVSGALPEHSRGYGVAQVHWRKGLWRYVARVEQVRGRGESGWSRADDDVSAVVHGDPAARLSELRADLRVVRDPGYGSDSSLLGWRVPSWLGLVGGALFVVSFVVLLVGPPPWRATRWAWFWLLMPPVGSIVFLLASGPTPLLPVPKRPTRRLTGGWAFLLMIPLAAWLAPYRW